MMMMEMWKVSDKLKQAISQPAFESFNGSSSMSLVVRACA